MLGGGDGGGVLGGGDGGGVVGGGDGGGVVGRGDGGGAVAGGGGMWKMARADLGVPMGVSWAGSEGDAGFVGTAVVEASESCRKQHLGQPNLQQLCTQRHYS